MGGKVCKVERVLCEAYASWDAWRIAAHIGCSYTGDANVLVYGGLFYSVRDWDAWGYADCVEFYEHPERDTVVIARGCINKPDGDESMRSALRCIGVDEEESDIHVQIEAACSWGGMETKDIVGEFGLDTWHEWRIWRKCLPALRSLAD